MEKIKNLEQFNLELKKEMEKLRENLENEKNEREKLEKRVEGVWSGGGSGGGDFEGVPKTVLLDNSLLLGRVEVGRGRRSGVISQVEVNRGCGLVGEGVGSSPVKGAVKEEESQEPHPPQLSSQLNQLLKEEKWMNLSPLDWSNDQVTMVTISLSPWLTFFFIFSGLPIFNVHEP